MSSYLPAVFIGVVLVGRCLRRAWKLYSAHHSARAERRRRESEYRTVCIYSENGNRFLVRKHVSDFPLAGEREIPDFLRKQPLDGSE